MIRRCLRIEVRCSAGTYIRTLADDLGRLLGGGAHLRNLRRTAVGSFGEDEALPPDECTLMAPVDALRDYPECADRRGHGRRWFVTVGCSTGFPETGRGQSSTSRESLLAVYELFGAAAKPAVVIA